MRVAPIIACTILCVLAFEHAEARKTSWTSLRSKVSSNSRSSSNTRRTSTPSQKQNQGGSSPDKIGWNVPEKKTDYPRQSASNPYHNTNSQPTNNAYQPSGGYRPQGQTPVGSSPVGGGYNSPVGGGYNGPVGGGYNAPPGMGHYGQPGGHAPYGGYPSHNPSYGGGYGGYGQPSYGGSPFGSPLGSSMGGPAQTVLLQQSKPGIGQLAKEAFVFAGVSAGVNAAVSRLLPGGIYGNRGSSGGATPVSHTEITYNNYYNNGTAVAPGTEGAAAAPAAASAAAPAAPQPASETPQASQSNPGTNSQPPATNSQENSQNNQNNANPLGFVTSNDDLKKLTESLYQKEKDNNAYQQITMKLQGKKADDSVTDDASEPLLDVKPEAFDLPTVKAVVAMLDNYELDVKTKEVVTPEERREESDLLDKILETDIMKSTMKFLSDKGYIPNDEYEFKDSLKRIWFSQFKRIDGDPSSSGFETVFLAEQFDKDILGLHNWIYYAKQEAAGKLNYLGYIKEAKIGDKGAVVKIRSKLNDIVQPVSTMFVGTSPELEIALYTMCFYTRPNTPCPVSLGGQEVTIFVSGISYFGKDILISAYPDV